MAETQKKKAADVGAAKPKSVQETITVSIAKLGEPVRDIQLPNGSTLKDALQAAGYEVANNRDATEGVRLSGRQAGLNDALTHGDFITVSPRVQGGGR